MKVLFLDIDGVLNSQRSCVAFNDYGRIGNRESWNSLDPVSVRLLRKIVVETGCKCVLSSTWRLGATKDDLSALSEFLGVDIIDKTPRVQDGFRGKEIQQWLDNNTVDTYCILDDDSDMLESQKEHFVETSHKVGLCFDSYEKCVAILGGQDD